MTPQAKFVIDLLNKKHDTEKYEGYYVELGAFHSFNGSNTYHLEKDYNWKGVAFDVVPEFVEEYNANRTNACILHDALTFDYLTFFKENNYPQQIDFLQVDVDAGYNSMGDPVGNPAQTLLALIALPLNTYRFSVITFEHDALMYYQNIDMREAQRVLLTALGYKLVVRNNYEDWWVDPKVIPLEVFREHISASVL